MNASQPDHERVARVRAALPATSAGIYLDTATAGPLPLETIAAMREVEDYAVRFGRAAPEAREELLGRLDEARAVAAAVAGADPSAVALTHGTIEGLEIAAWAPDWRDGDDAVLTTLDGPALRAALEPVRERFAVELRVAEVGDGGDPAATLAAIEAASTPRTRLVAAPHVSPTTGAVLPVAEIAALARRRDAWSAIDGTQAVGAIPVDARAIAADVYAFPSEVWLLGPEGVGAAVLSDRAIREARRVHGSEATEVRVAAGRVPLEASRFDASGMHLPSVVGFARGAGWLAMHVGLAWIHERGAGSARALAGRLGGIPGVSVVTPDAAMATIVTFRVAGWTTEEAAEALRHRAFAIVGALSGDGGVRASVGCFNTEAELAQFADAVEVVARHTPATMPRRPELVVLPE